MSRRTWLLITLLIIAIEGGVLGWRQLWLKPSTAPVFYWKGAELVTSAPPPFGRALEVYRPDRGAEKTISLPDDRKITLFYFEWDKIDVGPASLDSHRVEECNVVAGFHVLGTEQQRIYQAPNGESLCCSLTMLAGSDNLPIYVYKLLWIQGIGPWYQDVRLDRNVRLRRSFLNARGAARVLQAGIFGAASEDEAWAMFQREVLAKVEWQPALRPR